MEAFRYDSSNKGWAALAFGQEMAGALMFILYGDPSAPDAPLTLTVRTVDSHHPPRPIAEMDFYAGPVPDVDIVYTHFDEYTGEFFHEGMQKKPSHLGVAEFVVRGFNQWEGCPVSNTTEKQEFIWSSNFKQDFEGDFSEERHIDMHQFGLGFGFVWVDLANAVTPEPMFGPIHDLESHKGVNEIADPLPPTQDELDAGDAYIESHKDSLAETNPTPDIVTDLPPSTAGTTINPTATAAAAEEPQPTSTLNPNPVEQPVHNHKQGSLRDWMWHLHGLFMVSAFMLAYPLGIYFLRSPRATSFNLHWTIQSLGSMALLIGAVIGYWQSHAISVVHQYIGIALFVGVALQLLAGWRHHVHFLRVKQSSWITRLHIWAGRGILPLGMLNIFSGLKLRGYSWVVIGMALLVMVVELVALFVYIRRSKTRSGVKIGAPPGGRGGSKAGPAAAMTGAEAEEYFQLAGDDDEFSDSDAEAEGGDGGRLTKNRDEEREKAERLRRLDRV